MKEFSIRLGVVFFAAISPFVCMMLNGVEEELSKQIAKNKLLEDEIMQLKFMIDHRLGWEDTTHQSNE